MKALIKYACPLMMLGIPALIFAADTLRQLNAKSKNRVAYQVIQRGMIEAGCNSKAGGVLSVGGIYSSGAQFYRCVTIFDDRYQPVGTAWVAVDQIQSSTVGLHNSVALQY